jgi:hypothetical protein
VVQHADPARRAEANYIAFIALDDHGVPGWLEQIWAQRLTGDTFRLCCIPFFTYGFALGDSIEIRSVDGVQLVTRRIEPSGHTAVRLMANDKTPQAFTRRCTTLSFPCVCRSNGSPQGSLQSTPQLPSSESRSRKR